MYCEQRYQWGEAIGVWVRAGDISVDLSEFLLELYNDAAECGPDDLRRRTLRNLQAFVPFDFAVWGGGWADGRLVTDLTVLDQDVTVLGDWEAVAEQDAFCDLTLNNLGQTARFDDVANYRGGMAYNEHWRRFDASHMMATIVAEKTDGYVSFVGLCADDRPGAFTDAERVLKQMLMPHLSQAARINRAMRTRGTVIEREAVALVRQDGSILSVQGPFHDFAEAEWGLRIATIPVDMMATLRRDGEWRGQTLSARLSPFGRNCFVHVSLMSALSGLSGREREVAELFASGMTSKEVARTLGTSPSTVRNQVVRIYEKLGISNKAALASAVSRDRS